MQLMMDSARGYKPKNKIKIKNLKNTRIGFNSNTIVTIKIPILRIISQSLFLAVVVLTLPLIDSIIRGSSTDLYKSTTGLNLIDFELLSSLDNLVLTDADGQGVLCMNRDQLEELRVKPLSTSSASKRTLVPALNMRLWYAPHLELPDGTMLKGVTLVGFQI